MTMLTCTSRIDHVTVYARGALIRRTVSLPADLPADGVELGIPGVTVLAEAGSARTVVEGGREVVALKAEYVLPQGPAGPGAPIERIRALELEGQAIEKEREHLQTRRSVLAQLSVQPRMGSFRRKVDPAERARDALAVGSLLAEKTAALDARLRELAARQEENANALAAAHLDAVQDRRETLEGAGRPTLRFLVRLGPGTAPVRSLAIEYAVTPARWWPAYTARLGDAGARARWELEALIAQDSGEDWQGVKLALSTADLVQDARLPELPSLRLGKAQPARRSGFRPLPEGLDALFEGFDLAGATAPRPITLAPPKPVSPARPGKKRARRDQTVIREAVPAQDGGPASGVYYSGAAGLAPPPPPMPSPAMASPKAAMAPAPSARSAPPSADEDQWRAATRSRSIAAKMEESYAGEEGAACDELAFGGMGGGAPGAGPKPAEPPGIEPGEDWLDFDTLVLGDPEDRGRRGRIGRDIRPSFGAQARTARGRIDGLGDPPHARDPLSTRGRFDHRYDAEGTVDVPSNARPHRVTVAAAEAPAKPRFRTVPREGAEVFRETELKNPFDAPLLAGPVEVFVDGALSTTSSISAVDRGGSIRLGLGVEDRLRVARNVRAEESSAGLLGGTTAVDHEVTIDLSSALGHPATVEVIDRLPITDDKDVEVTPGPSKPAAEKYDQTERGLAVRGGLRWQVLVPPGGKARVDFSYQIRLPAKNEIVGGNRRD